MKLNNYAVAVAVAAGITLSGVKTAYGDLVFENDLNAKTAAQSEPNVAPADSSQGEASKTELSKSEVMRRQRLRQELKNEDILTQKLEEMRLKDEMKRSEELTGGANAVSAVNKPAAQETPLQEQRIGSAATQPAAPVPAQAQTAPAAAAPVTITGAPADTSTAASSVANAATASEASKDENHISIAPKFGTSSIASTNVNVSSKWGAGIDIGMDISDNFAVTGGYTYSTYSLSAGNNINYGYGYNASNYNLQTLNLNDNVISLGARFYITGRQSKMRPFVGGGGAYRKGYINYDSQTQQTLTNLYGPSNAQDVQISGFNGYVEAGAEFKITSSVSLTGSFRYFDVLSSTQSNPLNPNAFVGQGGYNYAVMNPLSYNNSTSSAAGGALAGQNFYQLMGGIQVTF